MGWSIDWTRELSTADPDYYRWTQWIFLQLFERGLAYKKRRRRSTGARDQTVLANEQVIDGRCERCGSAVERADLEQWFFKITDYADRLLDDLETLESWPERVLTMQRNWIGRSQGAEVDLPAARAATIDIPVFTTRPDTLFGATFMVLAPEHPLVARPGRAAPSTRRRCSTTCAAPPARRVADRMDAEQGEDRRVHRPARRSTRSTASGSRSGSPTTC